MNNNGFTTKQKQELQEQLMIYTDKVVRPMIKPLIDKLLEHDRRFESIDEQLKRMELLPTKEDFLDLMDKFMGRVTSCEEEHLFMESRLTRCEEHLGFA